MGKGIEANKQDFKAWLLKLQQDIGQPVVISLLVENNDVHFLAVVSKNKDDLLNKDDDGEESNIDVLGNNDEKLSVKKSGELTQEDDWFYIG